MDVYNLIQFEREGSRADLVLNNPPHNKLNIQMLEEINSALEPIRDDESFKILTIRGSGDSFSTGFITEELQAENIGILMPLYSQMFTLLNSIHGINLAVVNGQALGSGCELAAFCDIIFAGESAQFGFPEISLGLFPPIAVAVLPKLIGRQNTIDWIVSGDIFNADQAHQTQLISRIIPDNRLIEEADKFARRITTLSAPALFLAKRAVDSSLDATVMEAIRMSESTYMLDLMNSLDPHEGIKAAIEGRQPVWRDK